MVSRATADHKMLLKAIWEKNIKIAENICICKAYSENNREKDDNNNIDYWLKRRRGSSSSKKGYMMCIFPKCIIPRHGN